MLVLFFGDKFGLKVLIILLRIKGNLFFYWVWRKLLFVMLVIKGVGMIFSWVELMEYILISLFILIFNLNLYRL